MSEKVDSDAPTTVFLADDHAIVRSGLKSLLETQDHITVIGEAGDGDLALEEIKRLKPNVAVLDIEMPGVEGTSLAEQVRAVSSGTKVVILTMHDDPVLVRAALDTGASGFVLKKSVADDLVQAIEAAMAGRVYLNATLSQGESKRNDFDLLSSREREVFELLAYGYSNREIGKRLHLSEKTINTHRIRLQEKLGTKSRAELVERALELGVLSLKKKPR